MALFTFPLSIGMVLFGLFCFRVAATRMELNAAAASAARAASLARSPAAAQDAAQRSAEADLAGHSVTCNPMTVTAGTSAFRRGGQVTVTIRCRVKTQDLVGLGLPGSLTGSSTGRAVVDTWRSLDTP
jgi:hypothetical protein